MTKLLKQAFAAAEKLAAAEQDALAARWLAEMASRAQNPEQTLGTGEIDLASRGLNEQQIAELRFTFATFADGWNAPEMSDYDNYQPPSDQP